VRLSARICLGSLALLATACPSTTTPSTGQLDRPSGLAIVTRPTGKADVLRADLFVADSEAGGVRVAQMTRKIEAPTSSTALPTNFDKNYFVRAPALYFPLIVPTPRYPTSLAISADTRRLYVLSAIDSAVYVLSADETLLDVSESEDPGYQVLARLDLAAKVQTPGAPVDIEVLPPTGGALDTLLVALDPIGSTSGTLVALSVSSTFDATLVATATIASGPRRISVRTATPAAVFTNSVVGPTFTMVPLSGDGAVFGVGSELDAGGPTADIVDADTAGVLALRLDQPLGTVFDAEGGTLVRSTRMLPSPGILDSTEPGVVAFDSPVALGKVQRLSFLPNEIDPAHLDLLGLADLEADGRTPIVMVVHLDGSTSVLYGHPLRYAISIPSGVTRLQSLTADEVRMSGCTVAPVLTSCESRGDQTGKIDATFECGADQVVDPSSEGGIYRATYRGSLVREEGGVLEPVPTTTTATTAPNARITPRAVDATGYGFVRVGDRVYFEGAPPGCSTGPFTPSGEGIVTGVSASAVLVHLDSAVLAAAVRRCGAEPVPLDRWEIYPAAEEVVLAFTAGASLVPVERAPVTRVGSGWRAPLTQIVRTTLSSSAAPSCEPQRRPLETAASALDGAACGSNADCGGSTCDLSLVAGCFGHCVVSACAEGSDCFAATRRVCPGVELQLTSAIGSGFRAGVSSVLVASLPEEIVVSPIRTSWMISFPGARSVVEIRADDLHFSFDPHPVP